MLNRILHKTLFSLPVVFMVGLSSARAESAVTIFAASSLSHVMEDIIKNRPSAIKVSYSGSATIARQIEAGAPGDIFISANKIWMDYLVNRGLIDPNSVRTFARNRLVAVQPISSKDRFSSLEQYLRDKNNIRIAIGEPSSVPVGIYTRESLKEQGLWMLTKSNSLLMGHSVNAVLTWVERGEVDLGFIYATDVLRSDQVFLVEMLPVESHSPITYHIGQVSGRQSVDVIDAYALFKSKETLEILSSAGFGIN